MHLFAEASQISDLFASRQTVIYCVSRNILASEPNNRTFQVCLKIASGKSIKVDNV
jgi:hypothetical protein